MDANFTAFPAEENVPVTVRFRDLSSTRATAITSYAWDFDGDGLVDSTEANPTHVYTEPGLFTVTLTVSDGQLTDTLTRTDFMTTRAPTPGVVDSFQEISRRRGNFLGQLDVGEDFGVSLTELGDLDGDGINEVAVGVQFDNDGGSRRGAVWILFLNPDGTVRREQKISSTQGGFTGRIDDDDQFGVGVNALGDFNGDGGTGSARRSAPRRRRWQGSRRCLATLPQPGRHCPGAPQDQRHCGRFQRSPRRFRSLRQ